jgi:hypothetical protein
MVGRSLRATLGGLDQQDGGRCGHVAARGQATSRSETRPSPWWAGRGGAGRRARVGRPRSGWPPSRRGSRPPAAHSSPWGADWEQDRALYCTALRRSALNCLILHCGVLGVLCFRRLPACPGFVDTEEVTGSNPVSPTKIDSSDQAFRLVRILLCTYRGAVGCTVASLAGIRRR